MFCILGVGINVKLEIIIDGVNNSDDITKEKSYI